MTVEMDWRLVAIAVTLFLAWSGLLIGAIKILIERAVKSNDHRFDSIEEGLATEVEKREELEREFRTLLADMPLRYVQREDWIRLAMTIEAKMDTLNSKFDDFKDRVYARG